MLRRQAPQKVSATSRSFVAMAVCPATREDVNGKHRLAVSPSFGRIHLNGKTDQDLVKTTVLFFRSLKKSPQSGDFIN